MSFQQPALSVKFVCSSNVVWCVGGDRPPALSGSDWSVPAPMVRGPSATGGAEAGTTASVTPAGGRGHGAAVRSHLYLLAASLFSCSNNYIIAALNIWWWLIQNALPDSILTSQSSSVYSLLLSHLWVCASVSLSSYPLSIFSRYQTNVSISYSGHVLRFQAVCTNRASYPLQMFSYFLHSMSSVLSNKSQKLSMECLNNIVSSPQ